MPMPSPESVTLAPASGLPAKSATRPEITTDGGAPRAGRWVRRQASDTAIAARTAERRVTIMGTSRAPDQGRPTAQGLRTGVKPRLGSFIGPFLAAVNRPWR